MSLILSGTDGLSDVDGSAATPAIRGTDANTGIFFPAADTIAFSEGGVEAMRIDSSGNVGIGTTTARNLEVTRSDANTTYGSTAAQFPINVRNTDTTANNWAVIGFNQGPSSYANPAYVGAQFTSSSAAALTFGTSSTERMRIDSAGRVFVNSTSDVGGNNPVFSANAGAAAFSNIMEARWTGTGSIYHLLVRNANGLIGGVQSSGSTTAFLTSSDYRLKEDISPITGALAKVAQLKPVTYKWKVDGSDGEGFIAHELAEVCPIAVHGEKDELNEDGSIKSQSVDTSFLVATLTAAIQEQQALITALTARITALETP